MAIRDSVCTPERSTLARIGRALLLSLAALPLSCGGGEETPGESAPLVGDPERPLYAIGSSLYSAEGPSSFVAFVDGLGEGAQVDYEKVLELPGYGRIWGVDGKGAFYIARNEDASVTKYEVIEGRLEERQTIKLDAYGIRSFVVEAGVRIDFLSDTKAYLFDGATLKAIVWDPSTMAITGEIDLSELANTPWLTTFGFSETLLRGDQLVMFVTYEDFTQQRAASDLRVALIDTRTDAVTILRDERCAALYATRAGSGDIYFSSDGRAASYRRIDEAAAPAPCLLRLRAGEDALDPDFHVELSALTDGSPTAGIVPSRGEAAYVVALDEEVQPVEKGAGAFALYQARAWRWWRIELGSTEPGTRLEGTEPNAGGLVFLPVDGDVYTNESAPDYSESTLLRVTEDGFERGLVVRGTPVGIVRVQ
jgi:hypothetical protein